MKLEEDLKEIRHIRERMDLDVTDHGFVIVPAWQFVLFVKEYQSYRHSTFAWFGMFVILAAWFMIYSMMLR